MTDDKSTQTLTLQINDSQGNPVDVGESEITVETKLSSISASHADQTFSSVEPKNSLSQEAQPTFTPFKRQSEGVYETIVTSGTQTLLYTLIPKVRNVEISPSKMTITAGAWVLSGSSIAIESETSSYNAAEDIQVTVTLKDAHGNAVSGQANTLNGVVAVPNAGLKGWTEDPDPGHLYRHVHCPNRGHEPEGDIDARGGCWLC